MTRITDSALYSHLWGTDELREVLGEKGRVETWLRVLGALARAQARHDIVPEDVAGHIEDVSFDDLALDRAVAGTRASSHSMVGFIEALEQVLPDDVSRWVYYGATVQDVTDTATALAMRRMVEVAWRDLWAIEERLVDLAETHRDLVMAGRTHGQIGSPVTFGFKAAVWADEIRRHLERLRQGAERWLVGQLAGSVGTIAFLGPVGAAVRADFSADLGLDDPGISWTATRDRPAEFVQFLALMTSTLAKIGEEVYELQRSEIAELSEAGSAAAVGSITMPHKKNPEGAEHLVTLARLVRSSAQVMVESTVQTHERDGRGWKAEWVALPEACLLASTALRLGAGLVEDLEVDAAAMATNLAATDGYSSSEAVLAALSPRIGKHHAQRILYEAVRANHDGVSLGELLADNPEVTAELDAEELDRLVNTHDVGAALVMVDDTVVRIRSARSTESGEWQ